MLHAVTFDLWQTLIMDTPEASRWARTERVRGVRDILAGAGVAVTLETVDHAYEAVGERLEACWTTLEDLGAREQVLALLDALGPAERLAGEPARIDALIDALMDAYTLPILAAPPVANVGAREVVALLRDRGLRLAVICNTGRTPGSVLRVILDRLGLAQAFAVMTFSDEVGRRKPHPEIFRRTLEALGVAPAQALHLGDTLASDVAGASALGMHAVHLCHPRGSDACPGAGFTIRALPELPPLVDRLLAAA